MTKNLVRSGQVWISKQDGRLLYIGKRADGQKWNCTNSLSDTSHKISERNIQKYYSLTNDAITNNIKVVSPFVIKKLCNVTFKKKPWWLPKMLHRYLIRLLLETKSFTAPSAYPSRENIEDNICLIMRTYGSDGHTDGYDKITDYIETIIKGEKSHESST